MSKIEGGSKSAEVIVDLRKAMEEDSIVDNANEIIHQSQLAQVCDILNERISLARQYDPNNHFISQNDTISIFARRGAGKTTFIKSLVNLIRKGKEHPFGEIGQDLCCLDVFEPNQLSNKENLMIRFIAQIYESFRKFEEEQSNLELLYGSQNSRNEVLKNFKTAKHELYKALPVLEGVGSTAPYSKWDDSAYLADMCMESTMEMKDLEARFHKFIYAGLRLMNKNALLFVLDDSDVNIEKSFQILETLRLYFTSPQIIVMMTGDISLYGMTIRRNYWHFFDKDFLDKEVQSSPGKEKMKEYKKMVYRLENQYLQKMVKAHHRIYLNNIYDKYISQSHLPESESFKIKIKLGSDEETTEQTLYEIRELYKRIFRELDDKIDIDVLNRYTNHLLAQPFRNQLRLFFVYDQYEKLKKQKRCDTSVLVVGILKVFETYINQNSADSKFLMAHTPIYPAWLLKFLLENNILSIGSGLQPKMEEDSLKNAVLALGLSCHEQMKRDPSIIFDYWIRISLTRQLLEYLPVKNQESFVDFSHLFSDNGLKRILGKVVAYSVVSLYKDQEELRKTDNRSDSDILDVDKQSPFMPGLTSMNSIPLSSNYLNRRLIELIQLYVHHQGTRKPFFTVYNLIGFLGEFMRFAKEMNDDLGTRPSNRIIYISHLHDFFTRNTQVLSYMGPDVGRPYIYKNSDEKESSDYSYEIYNQVETPESQQFIDDMYTWYENSKNRQINVSPYQVDGIFSRFFHTLCNAKNRVLLGDEISSWVLGLWNSILIETMMMNRRSHLIELSNDKAIDGMFLYNYMCFLSCREEIANYDFFEWMIDCPLLKKYVNPIIILALKEFSSTSAPHSFQHLKDRFHHYLDSLKYSTSEDMASFWSRQRNNLSDRISIVDARIVIVHKYDEYYREKNSKENRIMLLKKFLKDGRISIQTRSNYIEEIDKHDADIRNLNNKMRLLRINLGFSDSNGYFNVEEKLDDLLKEKYDLGNERDNLDNTIQSSRDSLEELHLSEKDIEKLKSVRTDSICEVLNNLTYQLL